MSFMRGDLLTRMRKLVKAGIREKPAWLDAMENVPPVRHLGPAKRAPQIRLEEDPYVESYYARHPEAKMIPIKLKSFDDPPNARRFAQRQLALIKAGMDKRKARDVVEAEFEREREAGEAAAAREREQAAAEGRPLPPRHRSALEEFQEQEWKVVAQSMHALGTGRRLPS
eukprot:SM000105S13909  [mRNA]  locus=s105:428478:429401:- [translate_table: standard]